jgi:type IV pilus assembly protein PilB
MIFSKNLDVLTVQDLYTGSTPNVGDSPISEESLLDINNMEIIEGLLKNSFRKKGIQIKTIANSRFGDLESLVREMGENMPARLDSDQREKELKRMGRFKAHGMLPLVSYRTEGQIAEMIIGIQSEHRKQPISEPPELNNYEAYFKWQKFNYDIDSNEEISESIIRNLNESIFKLPDVAIGKINTDFVLLSIKEFDTLQDCLLDNTQRRKITGDIDEEGAGNTAMKQIFDSAVKLSERVSDIHIIPRSASRGTVEYRIDGRLAHSKNLTGKLTKSVIGAIRSKANMKYSDTKRMQDGNITFDTEDAPDYPRMMGYNLRIAITNTIHGESAVVRLLPQHLGIPNLEDLGYGNEYCNLIRELSKNSQGVILITGPTGSGKTTTLYSILQNIRNSNRGQLKIMTIEDPPEYTIEGITQVKVERERGTNFPDAIAGFLRHDPDIMLVGEVRDEETTTAAMRAASTGHLLFATVHTNDAVSTIDRLYDLGARKTELQSSLTAIIAQRLARKLCNDCKESYDGTKEINDLLQEGFEIKNITLYRSTGKIPGSEDEICNNCNGEGYSGRIVVPEIWKLNKTDRKLLDSSYEYDNRFDNAIKGGLIPLAVSGIEHVLKGNIPLIELDGRVVPKGDISEKSKYIVNFINNYK